MANHNGPPDSMIRTMGRARAEAAWARQHAAPPARRRTPATTQSEPATTGGPPRAALADAAAAILAGDEAHARQVADTSHVLRALAIAQLAALGEPPAELCARYGIAPRTLRRYREARDRVAAALADGVDPTELLAGATVHDPGELERTKDRRRTPDPLRLLRIARPALAEGHPDLVGALDELIGRLEDRRHD